jgi:hypothetical protein
MVRPRRHEGPRDYWQARHRGRPVLRRGRGVGPILIEKYAHIVEALPHQWTLEGKDLRAYAVQTHFNGGQIRITDACYSKTVSFKGVRINHLWTQLNSFVLGDKEASRRSDDLLDCAIYAASVVFRQRPVKKIRA